MTKNSPNYDKLIRDLAKILDDTKLTEIEYEAEGNRVRLSRQHTSLSIPQSIISPSISTSEVEPTKPVKSIPLETGFTVKAPMVGAAYLSPAPGEKTYINVGSKVKMGDTLLIIEAMKVMNPIKSPRDGVVKAILVNNSEPVEFDQPLLTLE